jgi:hypothetical protein
MLIVVWAMPDITDSESALSLLPNSDLGSKFGPQKTELAGRGGGTLPEVLPVLSEFRSSGQRPSETRQYEKRSSTAPKSEFRVPAGATRPLRMCWAFFAINFEGVNGCATAAKEPFLGLCD